ncbi:hypothetical protein EVJ58_g1251 [Rhodofomes roseus]|uniref:Beta-lactamase-related domain-containing protein n=1 Tax=Rhodofomes roseus TaxID=34475 RepID=A0A4Y9Z3S1_9APHY|nr:hypothetical protein EVJ58_g1251 [Rhodofomes roseus]
MARQTAKFLVALLPAIVGLTLLPLSRYPATATFWRSATPASEHPFVHEGRWAITPEIDTYARKVLEAEGVPGLSIAAVRLSEAGEVQTDWTAWGRMTEDGEPATADTLYNIGSCSKAFLVTALGLLMEDYALGRNVTALPRGMEQFNWETKIREMFDTQSPLIFADPWARSQASLLDVLSHMSGIGSQEFVYSDMDSPTSVLQRVEHLRPAYELRERFSYTNIFYTITAHVIATYSGISYESFVIDRIFAPLGMTSTTYAHAEAIANGRLSHSFTTTGRRVPFWLGNNATTAWAGPAGIMSNVVDMSKWLATLLNGGVKPRTNTTIIPLSVYEEMTTARAVVFGAPRHPYLTIEGYGMGWERQSFQGHDVVSHTGRMPAHLSEVFFLPSDRLGVVALSNGDLPQEAYHKIAMRVIEDALALPHIADPDEQPPQNDTTTQDEPHNDSENATVVLSASLARYAGTYANPAYGNFTLCAPTTTSAYCARVLADFVACDELHPHPALYGAYPPVHILPRPPHTQPYRAPPTFRGPGSPRKRRHVGPGVHEPLPAGVRAERDAVRVPRLGWHGYGCTVRGARGGRRGVRDL